MIENKDVTITYTSLDELVEREPKMVKSLENYLKRHPDYEHIGNEILFADNGKYILVLKTRLKAV